MEPAASERISRLFGLAEVALHDDVAAHDGELIGYVKMAVEPEIQRIVLLDGPAVLGDPSRWPGQQTCVRTTKKMLEALMDEGTIREVDSEAMARLISGAALSAALWIADADDPPKASKRAVESLGLWLAGLRA
jgi:hypothetical protein